MKSLEKFREQQRAIEEANKQKKALLSKTLSERLVFYSKTCVKGPLSKKKKTRKLVFKTNYRLIQVKSIAECSNGSILQYIRPSLSYHLSLRSLFCLFLSDRFTQVLLYSFYGFGFNAASALLLGKLTRDDMCTPDRRQ